MKKFFAVLVAMMMLMSCAALAEGTAEVNFDETACGYEGEWMQLSEDDTVMLFLPSDAEFADVTDEQAAVGMYCIVNFAGGSMQVFYNEQEGVGLESLAAGIEQAGLQALSFTLNGLSVLACENPAQNCAMLYYSPAEGAYYSFVCTPADNAEFSAVAQQVLYSVSAVEAE